MVGIVDDFDYLRKNFNREVSIQRPQFSYTNFSFFNLNGVDAK